MRERLFFSVVMPAHNEGGYIEDTLAKIAALEYPQDRFEILVIENGSTDDTYAKAKRFARSNLRVYSFSKKGVSGARNRGSELARADSDWVLFLDADTHVAPNFLAELDAFMRQKDLGRHAAGAMSIQPLTKNVVTMAFFRFANFCRRLTKFPFAAFLIRRDLLERIQFDEEQQVGEDARLFADACRYGPAFFFHTDLVHTSVRRFKERGRWFRTTAWLSMMPLAGRAFHKVGYKVIR